MDWDGLFLEIIDFGCKVNQAEGSALRDRLSSLGFVVAERWERPDVTVINSCAVTAAGEAKARKESARAKRRGARMVVLTGCVAEIRREGWEGPSRPDLVIPQSRKDELPEILLRALPFTLEKQKGGITTNPRARARTRAKAFVKVQDGCGHPCTYCIVPLARGGPVSLSLEHIITETKACLERGVGEVVLCGINLGAWRGPGGLGLDRLVKEVLELDGGFRVRLSSLDPEDLMPGLLEGLAGEDRLCPHFHLPLQSGSDAVLKAMGRGYGAEEFLHKVETIRSLWKNPALTTDVMVGFPGEKESDFQATMELLKRIRPARMHVFRYSPRPGTAAARMSGHLDETTKKERAARLACLGAELARAFARSQVGRIKVLLAEELMTKEGKVRALGVTEDYLRGAMEGDCFEIGRLYRGEVTGEEGPRLSMRRMPDADGKAAEYGGSAPGRTEGAGVEKAGKRACALNGTPAPRSGEGCRAERL